MKKIQNAYGSSYLLDRNQYPLARVYITNMIWKDKLQSFLDMEISNKLQLLVIGMLVTFQNRNDTLLSFRSIRLYKTLIVGQNLIVYIVLPIFGNNNIIVIMFQRIREFRMKNHMEN